MTTKTKSLIGKFIKGAIAGGLASVAVSLQSNYSVASLSDLVTLANILGTAFLSGTVLSAMKYLAWQE